MACRFKSDTRFSGCGAHSRLNQNAIHQVYKPDLWLKNVFEKNSGEQKRKLISNDERIIEIIMMGLRLKDGINLQKFQTLTGRPIDDCIDHNGYDILIENNLIRLNEQSLYATDEGRKCLNGVIEKLIT